MNLVVILTTSIVRRLKLMIEFLFRTVARSFDYSKWVANAGEGVENITYKARKKEE